MRRGLRGSGLLILAVLLLYGIWSRRHSGSDRDQTATVNPLEEMLRLPASVSRQEGTAAVILMDTSGSMNETVSDVDGQPKPKIAIARRAVAGVVRRFHQHSEANPGRPLLVGVYEFSSRDNQPPCRPVIRLGLPRLEELPSALDKMVPDGGTPIGDAMIKAKQDLDLTGMSRRHIVVVTDGENNRGYSPGAVADYLARQPETDRASLYFVAFDVAADRFKAIRDAGGLVLAAANENDLNQTLDFILTGKILVEQPASR